MRRCASRAFFGRFSETSAIKTTEVAQYAQSLAQRQNLPAQYLPFLMPRFEAQAEQVLVAAQVEDREADRLGLTATEGDVQQELQTGQLGAVFFPRRQVHRRRQVQGDSCKTSLALRPLPSSRARCVKRSLRVVSSSSSRQAPACPDNEVRELVRKEGAKVKFDYAVVSAADLAKTINPIDSDLENYFNRNKARYATADS